jgi:2-oxoisovalerate dehydrogenase E1 component beta subunit
VSQTIRTPSHSVGHGGLYHSQSPEGFFMGAAGLTIVVPRSPIQAKGLLLAAVREPNPVLFLEPKVLYRSAVEHVPEGDYTLPLGAAETLRAGADCTLLAWGPPLYQCEGALALLAAPPPALAAHVPQRVRGARVEVIDLRSILPWDVDTVVESVRRTGRLVLVHEAGRTAGVGAEIAAEVQRRCFLKLHAPVRRVTGWECVLRPRPRPLRHDADEHPTQHTGAPPGGEVLHPGRGPHPRRARRDAHVLSAGADTGEGRCTRHFADMYYTRNSTPRSSS